VTKLEYKRFQTRTTTAKRHLFEIDCMPVNQKTTQMEFAVGQKSIICVQNEEIHPLRTLDLTSLACLTQTLRHRIRPASTDLTFHALEPDLFDSLPDKSR
jgi:hypothetical protein